MVETKSKLKHQKSMVLADTPSAHSCDLTSIGSFVKDIMDNPEDFVSCAWEKETAGNDKESEVVNRDLLAEGEESDKEKEKEI